MSEDSTITVSTEQRKRFKLLATERDIAYKVLFDELLDLYESRNLTNHMIPEGMTQIHVSENYRDWMIVRRKSEDETLSGVLGRMIRGIETVEAERGIVNPTLREIEGEFL